jgi:hypothetical protein
MYIISNEEGKYFRKFNIWNKPIYVPRKNPEFALKFKTKEEAEDFIFRKLHGLHVPIFRESKPEEE